jgi:hypothetical protein
MGTMMRTAATGLCAVSVVLAALATTTAARADEPLTVEVAKTGDASDHTIDRTWLYVDDARVAAPLTAIATTSAAYTTVGSDPSRAYSPYRAFSGNTAQPGALVSLGGEVGLLPRVSIAALGQMGVGGVTSPNAGAIVGLRFQLSPPSWENVHLVASAGYLREAWAPPLYDEDPGGWTKGQSHGDNGAWAEAGVAADLHRAHLGFTAHGEHVFADGRDGVDLMFRAGASYDVVGPLRAGVEWVGQDLEEAFNDGAEGGARQFVGPTASVRLLQDRLTVVGGPSFGLSPQSPRLLGRIALAYGF